MVFSFFALGVTLIEALTGELPVRRGGALDPGPLAALLERGHVAPPLRDLITRATASDPAARPSAVALSTSLERFLVHLKHGDRDAGVGKAHGDAAAHGARTDDTHGFYRP